MSDRTEEIEPGVEAVPAANQIPPERLKLYTYGELRSLPPVSWLVDGLIPNGEFSVLYGPSGDGKTFVGLDLALSIAAGIDWHDRPVTSGPIVYLSAESGRGIPQRIDAWLRQHERQDCPETARFFIEPAQFRQEEDVALLLQRLGNIKPVVFVVDTLARCLLGGDENSAKDMGEFVEGVRQLQVALGCAVLVIHHTGKSDAEIERGSSALRAATNAMILVKKNDGIITIKTNRQKDGPESPPFKLRLSQVTLADGRTTSCVVESIGEGQPVETRLPGNLRRALQALASMPNRTAQTATWRLRVGRNGQVVPAKTFSTWSKKLREGGLVSTTAGTRGVYQLTEAGAIAIGAPVADGGDSHNSDAATATTL